MNSAGLIGFEELPREIRGQLDSITELWKRQLGGRLIGLYLHGSIALHAFRPESGDLDMLAVVRDSLHVEEKLALARGIIALDGKPCPIEISAVTLHNAQNWKNPGGCVFHYSDFWKEKYLTRFRNPDAEVYVVDHEFPDPDVTSYIRLIRQCGVGLCGAPIEAVFAPVSDEDFWAAISNEAEDYDFHSYAPRYLASNVLILGRILSFKIEKKILSKYDAGLWMLRNLPPEFTELIENAMKIWYEGKTCTLPEKELEKLRLCLIGKIKK